MTAEEILTSVYKKEPLRKEEKIRLLTENIEAYEKEMPEDAIGLGTLYNEIGLVWQEEGNNEKALEAFLKAKELIERPEKAVISGNCPSCQVPDELFGTGERKHILSINYASVNANTASALRETGRLSEAKELFETAVRIYKLNADTPENMLASCYNGLAQTCMKMKDYKDAARAFQGAACHLEQEEGMEEPFLITRVNLAAALFESGAKEEAASEIVSALKTAGTLLGEDHPLTKEIMNYANALSVE